MDYFSQAKLIVIMQALGYSEKELAGHCYGFSQMARNAFLAGEIVEFQKRLQIIQSLTAEDIDKIKKGRFDQTIDLGFGNKVSVLDIQAFFDGVTLFQRPVDYKHLFVAKGNFAQQENLAEDLVRPIALESDNAKPVKAIEKGLSGSYTSEELSNLLILLQEHIDVPFSISNASSGHEIMVHFDSNAKRWLFIDPNKMPGQYYSIDDTTDLADAILTAHNFSMKPNSSEALSLLFYVKSEAKDKFIEKYNTLVCKDEWKKNVEVTEERAKRVSPYYGSGWLCIASLTGDAELLRALIEAGAEVNQVNKDDVTPLMLAAQSGHLQMVEALIEAGAEVNQVNNDGVAPLMIAALNGHSAVVSNLIEAKANVQASNGNWTSLLAAAINGHTEVLAALIEAGAKVNQADKDGYTPLHVAAQNGHLQVVEALIKAGADVNQANKDGFTPLMVAVRNGHVRIAEALLKAGATPNPVNERGMSLIELAFDSPNPDTMLTSLTQYAHSEKAANLLQKFIPEKPKLSVVERLFNWSRGVDVEKEYYVNQWRLLRNAVVHKQGELVKVLWDEQIDITRATPEGETLLWSAALGGDLPLVLYLLEKGADVNQANKDGFTPLMLAAQKGYLKVLEALIDSGAKVNQTDKDGLTSLMLAAQNGHLKVLEALIEAGANVNQTDKDGLTPLILAAQNGYWTVVKKLIEKNADVQASHNGYTPLYIAAQNGHLNVLEALIDSGAEVNQADKDGYTPLYVAAQNGHWTVVKKLIEKNADVHASNNGYTPLYVAAQNGHLKVVEALIEAGAAVNQANNNGYTPLMLAAKNGQLKVLEALIGAGAAVNQASNNGLTPLMLAAQNGHLKVVEALIGAGAAVNQANNNGLTPLMLAAQNGHLKVVEALIGAGAKVNQTDKDGYTPLMLAAQNGHEKVLEVLVQAGADKAVKNTHQNTVLMFAALGGDRDCVSYLLDQGEWSDVDAEDNDGDTALGNAIYGDSVEIIEKLLQREANINHQNKEGKTPLIAAVEEGRFDYVKLLIEKGADVNIKDGSGKTALAHAIEKNSLEMVVMLTTHPAMNKENLKEIHVNEIENKTIKTYLKDFIGLNQHDKSEVRLKYADHFIIESITKHTRLSWWEWLQKNIFRNNTAGIQFKLKMKSLIEKPRQSQDDILKALDRNDKDALLDKGIITKEQMAISETLSRFDRYQKIETIQCIAQQAQKDVEPQTTPSYEKVQKAIGVTGADSALQTAQSDLSSQHSASSKGFFAAQEKGLDAVSISSSNLDKT